MQRFDEMELHAVPLMEDLPVAPVEREHATSDASRVRRIVVLLTDLSLFAALSIALSPLLPAQSDWIATAGLAGFVLVVSFYYFAGSWLLWGKTVGGTIFDVRVVDADRSQMRFKAATLRWAGLLLSLLTAGLGFLLAAGPARRSLPDRMSGTRCITA
ncbi:MAG: RDD family protein [Thermoanaerobaculia bacterium]|nr:RDD family protein [Thermoanaerobaculia bacterium]